MSNQKLRPRPRQLLVVLHLPSQSEKSKNNLLISKMCLTIKRFLAIRHPRRIMWLTNLWTTCTSSIRTPQQPQRSKSKESQPLSRAIILMLGQRKIRNSNTTMMTITMRRTTVKNTIKMKGPHNIRIIINTNITTITITVTMTPAPNTPSTKRTCAKEFLNMENALILTVRLRIVRKSWPNTSRKWNAIIINMRCSNKRTWLRGAMLAKVPNTST